VSNTNNYIITTLSSGSSEYVDSNDVQIQAPFSIGAPSARNLRLTGAPYVIALGNAESIFTRNVISPDSPEPATSYYSPFIYTDFEITSSTTVTVTGSQSTYSGTLEDRGWTGGDPTFQTVNAFSGSYSLQLYNSSVYNTKQAYVNFDTPANRPEWETLFSESFSISAWVRPANSTQSTWQYNGIFWLKNPSASEYSFMLILGSNSDTSTDGSVGWYVSGSTPSWNWFPSASVNPIVANQWNHIVWAISGSILGNRSISAYVNGIDVGTPYKAGGASTGFSNTLDTSHAAGLGAWYYAASYMLEGMVDEVSAWNFELNSGQVSKLYNGGSGKNAMIALTQSS
jgi:hypothetical protein